MRQAEPMTSNPGLRIAEAIAGAIIGFVVGAIVAVNVVITAGVDRGYQASLTEVFEESTLLGVAVVAILVAGPIVGVIGARRIRQKMDQ